MELPNTIDLPLSSNDPILGLLDCYLDAFGDNIPTSAYINPFNQDSEDYLFELFTQTNKYLGESNYLLSSTTVDDIITITNEITNGQNFFNPFSNTADGLSISSPISSSFDESSGATAGNTIDSADVVWQFVDGGIEGAWYKRSDEEFVSDTTNIRFINGSNEMRFPYADRGLSAEGLEWTGKGIDNSEQLQFVDDSEQELIDLINQVYWSDDSEISSVNSIALNQTSLIDDGAYADRNIFNADQIQVRPNIDSDTQDLAWLFDFNHTELPISCGQSEIHFPLFIGEDSTNRFYDIPTNQTEDLKLSDINITNNMCGAIAGLDVDSADQIYKKSGACGLPIEGAWLKGSDVSELAMDIYLLAEMGDILNISDVYIDNNRIELSGSYVSGGTEFEFENCCESGTRTSEVSSFGFEYSIASFNPIEGFDYRVELDIDESNVTLFADGGVSGSFIENYLLSTDGSDRITVENNGDIGNVNAVELITGVREVVPSISGASRQNGLHAVFSPNVDGHFFWEFPDIDLTEAINGHEHDDYCNYLDLDNYSSIINPTIEDELNQWTHCNCKAVYHSPVGNALNDFENNKEFHDIVFEDTGVEPFSFSTWRDSDGNDYRTSNKFAVFHYSGREPDVGYGIGFWETLLGTPMILEQGQSYIYRRASYGGCDDNRPPCFVINNCHCYDRCGDNTANAAWTRMVQNSDGIWESTDEPTDMTLESNVYYDYVKQGTINYNIYKNRLEFSRETGTPSYSLNIPFKEAKPYWAETPNVRGLNVGLSALETDSYLLTTQPRPSEIVLSDDMYVNYVRNFCDPFFWRQSLNFTVDFEIPNCWKRLEFGFTNPDLLRNIIGCGGCELVFDDTPDSCFLKEDRCNSYVSSISATDIDSDMVFRSGGNCRERPELFYSSQNDFTWTNTIEINTPITTQNSNIYTEAVEPWLNLINENRATIYTRENTSTLQTKGEIGLFKPDMVGNNKIQNFGETITIR